MPSQSMTSRVHSDATGVGQHARNDLPHAKLPTNVFEATTASLDFRKDRQALAAPDRRTGFE